MDQYDNDSSILNSDLNSMSHETDTFVSTAADSVNDVDKVAEKSEQPPAVRVPLTGKYLIEASAGTGKTWTLTGIVLRLLIEAKRAPEHIIATTFTRAAAAEMRERIHARLVDFYQVLQWLNKLQADTHTHPILYPQFNDISNKESNNKADSKSTDNAKKDKNTSKVSLEQKQARLQWLEQQAKLAGTADLVTDPINSYLIEYLLDHTEDYPLADAIRRCALVLTTLDKLFVGTLDSLSQKWLSEYSAETGHQQGMQISDDEQTVIESIIHDAVRAHHSYMYYQQPEIYQLLQHTNRLTTPADHLNVAQKSLQFISTPIEPVDLSEPIDFIAYQHALENFKNCDLTDVKPYFDKDYRKAQGMTWNASLATKVDHIGNIQTAIQQNGTAFFTHLDEETQKFYDALPYAFLSKDDGGKGFNKGKELARQTFINLDSIQALKTLHDYTHQIELYLDGLIENLNRDIALKVRQKLPSILEERRETTFALQMVRLNQALAGKQGQRLARYIRHHYPIALIDESQDINGEQARMIERIYLSKTTDNKDPRVQDRSRGFLLLVGDPKQAIYGFRGGDVANYNAMKARFDDKHIMSLNVNRRSNERLITALNHWFGRSKPASNMDESIGSGVVDELAQLGKGIYYQHITAVKTESLVSWQQSTAEQHTSLSSETASIALNSPVSVIHLPYDKEAKHNACELTALHIAALLGSQQTIEGRPLKPSDIGVLGRTKKDLKQVEDMLAKLGVPTLETAENNVFDTPIAADLAALLEAMLRPHRRDIINRVLTSHFYQLSLNDVQALMQSVDDDSLEQAIGISDTVGEQAALKQRYQDFQNYIKIAASQWQHNGILSALHYLFGHNPMAYKTESHTERPTERQSIWVGLADLEDGARYLMDLRHLMDILAQYGMHIGEHEMLAWYKKNMNSKRTPEWAKQQPLPTESGVQLMTIHKSKGLEFPVVYVIGMDGTSKKAGDSSKHNLFLFDHKSADSSSDNDNNNDVNNIHNNKTERRLSACKGKPNSKSAKRETLTDYYAQFETTENYEELRRLAYVAFTRASEQLYMVLADSYNKTGAERKPSLKWLSCEDHKFTLPERLYDHIGWLEYSTVANNAETIVKANEKAAKTDNNKVQDASNTMSRIDYQDAYAQIRVNYFKGWAKTSFTALSRQLSEQGKALAVFDDGIEDDLDLTDGVDLSDSMNLSAASTSRNSTNAEGDESSENNSALMTADNVRFRFVRGANAGTFLHEVFEKIDFNNHSKWSAIIDQGIRQYQLPVSYTSAANQQRLLQDIPSSVSDKKGAEGSVVSVGDDSQLAVAHDELVIWISDVLAAPLLASGKPLQAISSKQRIAELSFNMGLADDFTPERINEVFKQHLPDDPDKHIQLTAQHSDHIYRYLRGEIDLVYEHAGKFYVVDYKSNYLGNSLSDYNDENLSAAMNKAGYWLQAAIYQVALHRFLRLRLHDYEGNEEQYLGAVEYLFLRGIDSKDSQSDAVDNNKVNNYGRIQWQIPFTLVQALDEMFGTPKAYS
ncbi:UvrD-helicase domain-containing protein [Psychrobacter sp. FBL11]|uniref:RecBCD enzyme subunit RecB n=1 Tax=Psychrobacter saeujeotis TaxID=3143436 RepID=A0ABU9X689_9GAMM|nr:UvrD-helicase domain-containing protein [uncultured Psychrobacter sp.]